MTLMMVGWAVAVFGCGAIAGVLLERFIKRHPPHEHEWGNWSTHSVQMTGRRVVLGMPYPPVEYTSTYQERVCALCKYTEREELELP